MATVSPDPDSLLLLRRFFSSVAITTLACDASAVAVAARNVHKRALITLLFKANTMKGLVVALEPASKLTVAPRSSRDHSAVVKQEAGMKAAARDLHHASIVGEKPRLDAEGGVNTLPVPATELAKRVPTHRKGVPVSAEEENVLSPARQAHDLVPGRAHRERQSFWLGHELPIVSAYNNPRRPDACFLFARLSGRHLGA